MEIILASASPRRRELMSTAGFDFTVEVSDVDESVPDGTPPQEAALITARRKTAAVAKKHPDCIVVGADTIVVLDNEIMGKPADRADAKKMITSLSGRTHTVITGVCVMCGGMEISFAESTGVEFYALTEKEIDAYVATGECDDKAGAYGIQGKGCVLVRGINGDYFNVVGLPIARTSRAIYEIIEAFKN